MTRTLAAVLALTVSLTLPAFAASLAGQAGDVRHKPYFPFGSTGGCQKAWQQYVAAPGHAAYAVTPYSRTAEAIMCGMNGNAGSTPAAEGRALAACNNALKKYKLTAVRNCEIAASK